MSQKIYTRKARTRVSMYRDIKISTTQMKEMGMRAKDVTYWLHEWWGEIKMSRLCDANSYRYNGDSHCRCSAALQL